MRKAVLFLIVGLLVLLAVIGLVIRCDSQSTSQAQVIWGGPTLCVSERDYFMTRMASLLDTWGDRRFRGGFLDELGEEGRYLVFDLEGRLIWLVRQDETPARDYVELPAAVSWKLYSHSEDGLDEMPSLVCFRPSRRWRGTLAVVGRAPDNTHFSCAVRAPFFNARMTWDEGEFDPNSLSSSGPAAELSSVLVTDPNHLQEIMLTRPSFVAPDHAVPADEEGLDPMAKRKAIWHRLQKPLYQALEQQAIDRGYEVARISVQPGPDYTAGLAGIGIKSPRTGPTQRFLSFLLRRRSRFAPPFLFFTVDALEDGRWHCQTTQIPGGGPSRVRDGFDFCLEQPESGLDANLPRPEPDEGTSEWFVELYDGTCVELIGVCALPGSTWWAPDGSALDHWPGFWGEEGYNRVMFDVMSSRSGRIRMRRMPMDREQEEGRVAVVLRVPSSVGFGNRSGSSSSGSVSVHYGKSSPLLDRFGRPGSADSSVQYIVLQFDASGQDVISHALGIRVGDAQTRPETIRQSRARSGVRGGVGASGRLGGSRAQIPSGAIAQPESDSDLSLQWIQLKNISLCLGRQTEFEMTVTEDAGGIASMSKVQVRP
jgi:hypothetical protein